MVLGVEVGHSPGDFVLDGDVAPSPKRDEAPPQFSVHLYCGQTVGCIKMPLGMEVDLDLREKGAHPHPTQFWSTSIVAKWLDG